MGAEIKAKMSLDSSGVKAGVEQAKGHVSGFNMSLKSMAGTLGIAFGAGAAVAGLKAITASTIELAGINSDLAQQTGLSVEQLQAFKAAAMGVSGGAEAAEKGLIQLRVAQQEALDGNKAQTEAFARLGISIDDVAKKTSGELLESVAKGYKATGDFSAIVDVFGRKNAPKMEAALLSLADGGFKPMIKDAKDAGLVMGGELTEKLDAAGDAIDRMKLKAKIMWSEVLVGAVKAVQFLEPVRKAIVAFNGSVLADQFQNVKDIFTGNWSEIKNPFEIVGDALKAGKAGYIKERDQIKEDTAADAKKRDDEKIKAEKRDLESKNTKLDALKKSEADAVNKAAEEQAKKDAEAAAKELEKKQELERKALEKKQALEQKALEKLAGKEAAAAGVSVTELRGAGSQQYQQRFDSLRQIGANVLGSGITKGSMQTQEQRIASATERTAEGVQQLVEKIDRPPVTRMAQSVAVY